MSLSPLLTIGLVIPQIVGGIMVSMSPYPVGVIRDMIVITGYVAVGALLLCLLLPWITNRWLQPAKVRGFAWRRDLGLSAFYWSVCHGVWSVFHSPMAWRRLDHPEIFLGWLALGLLLLMFMTSFGGRWGQGRWRYWRVLHLGVYPALLVAWLHVLTLSTHLGTWEWALMIVSLMVAGVKFAVVFTRLAIKTKQFLTRGANTSVEQHAGTDKPLRHNAQPSTLNLQRVRLPRPGSQL